MGIAVADEPTRLHVVRVDGAMSEDAEALMRASLELMSAEDLRLRAPALIDALLDGRRTDGTLLRLMAAQWVRSAMVAMGEPARLPVRVVPKVDGADGG